MWFPDSVPQLSRVCNLKDNHSFCLCPASPCVGKMLSPLAFITVLVGESFIFANVLLIVYHIASGRWGLHRDSRPCGVYCLEGKQTVNKVDK